MRGSFECFQISIDDQEGSLSDGRLSFDWYPFRHFGLGVGYNRFVADYENLGKAELGFRYELRGGLAYVTYVY